MKHLILIFIFLTALVSAQSWTGVKETNINVNNALSVDVFTNGAGNHIIVQESNALKYYKMNVNGTAGSAITLESSSVVSPSISGDATRIYVVYRKSSENYIRTKHSSDGGTNWNYLGSNPDNSNAGSIECVFSNNKLHVTFEVSNVVYYAYFNTESSVWTSTFTVSTNENGNYPSIAAWYTSSEDKVYVIYSNTSSLKKWREYNVTTNTWGNINEAFNISNSGLYGIAVDANNIYTAASYISGSLTYFNLIARNRSNNNLVSSYSTPETPQKIYSTTTADGVTHTPFYWTYIIGENYLPGIYRRKGNAGPLSWDQVYQNNNAQPPSILNLSSSSNDVHVIWKDNLGNNNGQNLRYKYDDQAPLAPQNLTVSAYNGKPMLQWTANNEPDINIYKIYKKKDSPNYS